MGAEEPAFGELGRGQPARAAVSPFGPEPSDALTSPASRLQYGAVVSGALTRFHFPETGASGNAARCGHSEVVYIKHGNARRRRRAVLFETAAPTFSHRVTSC